jgi:hypothetical protein
MDQRMERCRHARAALVSSTFDFGLGRESAASGTSREIVIVLSRVIEDHAERIDKTARRALDCTYVP